MTLTLTPRAVDEYGSFKTVPGSTSFTVTSITLDANYVVGGFVLTPAQLGLTSNVYFGVVTVRTGVASASPSNGTLDCSTPTAPKLKLLAAGALAELANGAGSGAIVDVLAFGI